MIKTSRKRIWQRLMAHQMKSEGRSVREIAEYLGVKKEQVAVLIKEQERCGDLA